MNDFKEWLSDYLRYFMLAAAAILVFGIIIIGVNIYRSMIQPNDENVIEIMTESMTETETETNLEIATETETEMETKTESEDVTQPESEIKEETESETEIESETEVETEIETEIETETETETETESEYKPVYKTLIGSCYIRSAPSMEAEILGEYIYGTTVEFLEDVGGWYKVQIDGMVGYMGARFFEE